MILEHCIPLPGASVVQVNNNRFALTWDGRMNRDPRYPFLWVYKENELNMPQLYQFGALINPGLQMEFQFGSTSITEIQKTRFMVFLLDNRNGISQEDMRILNNIPEFICEAYCGNGSVAWKWVTEKNGIGLEISSDKKIPEGLLYFTYQFGGKQMEFEIPGEISPKGNRYSNILLPLLEQEPQLRSRIPNLNISQEQSKGLRPRFKDIFKKN